MVFSLWIFTQLLAAVRLTEVPLHKKGIESLKLSWEAFFVEFCVSRDDEQQQWRRETVLEDARETICVSESEAKQKWQAKQQIQL